MTDTIEKLVQQIGTTLKAQKLTLTAAESCTGGGLSFWLTSIPKCSEWFECGFVTYSEASKSYILGIPPEDISIYDAVSEEIALAMAKNALERSTADLSIAITGFAGPDGGNPENPVGTVWIAWAKRDKFNIAQKNFFSGDRTQVRDKSIEVALKKLLDLLNTKK